MQTSYSGLCEAASDAVDATKLETLNLGLYTWHARLSKQKDGAGSAKDNTGLRCEDKFAIVLEAASMNEHELSAYCREKGLHPQQIRTWRKQCQQANEPGSDKVAKNKLQKQNKQIKGLEKELQQKEKALAETQQRF